MESNDENVVFFFCNCWIYSEKESKVEIVNVAAAECIEKESSIDIVAAEYV